MNEWMVVAAVLGVAPCLVVCATADAAHGLVALEVGSVLMTTILMALCEGLQRQPSINLALT